MGSEMCIRDRPRRISVHIDDVHRYLRTCYPYVVHRDFSVHPVEGVTCVDQKYCIRSFFLEYCSHSVYCSLCSSTVSSASLKGPSCITKLVFKGPRDCFTDNSSENLSDSNRSYTRVFVQWYKSARHIALKDCMMVVLCCKVPG